MKYLYRTVSEEDTTAFAGVIGAHLSSGESVLLIGDLGMGKSVLARGIARALGVSGPMPSPSFPMLISYTGDMPFYHYDLYRLSGIDEFYDAGLDEYIGAEGVACVEWPEMADIDPTPALKIELERGEGVEERRFAISSNGIARFAEMAEALAQWEVRHEDTRD